MFLWNFRYSCGVPWRTFVLVLSSRCVHAAQQTSSKRKTILMKTRKYKDNQQRKNFVQNESKMFLNQYFKKIEKDSNEKYCQ